MSSSPSAQKPSRLLTKGELIAGTPGHRGRYRLIPGVEEAYRPTASTLREAFRCTLFEYNNEFVVVWSHFAAAAVCLCAWAVSWWFEDAKLLSLAEVTGTSPWRLRSAYYFMYAATFVSACASAVYHTVRCMDGRLAVVRRALVADVLFSSLSSGVMALPHLALLATAFNHSQASLAYPAAVVVAALFTFYEMWQEMDTNTTASYHFVHKSAHISAAAIAEAGNWGLIALYYAKVASRSTLIERAADAAAIKGMVAPSLAAAAAFALYITGFPYGALQNAAKTPRSHRFAVMFNSHALWHITGAFAWFICFYVNSSTLNALVRARVAAAN